MARLPPWRHGAGGSLLSGLAGRPLRGPSKFFLPSAFRGASNEKQKNAVFGEQASGSVSVGGQPPLLTASRCCREREAPWRSDDCCCRLTQLAGSHRLLAPREARAFGSRSRRKLQAFWEAEHLASDLQNEAQQVEEAEQRHAALTGREVKSVWESKELQDEFERNIGRRRSAASTRRATVAAAATAASGTAEGVFVGPASQVEADWRDWLQRCEEPKAAFSPPLPPNLQRRGRRRQRRTAPNSVVDPLAIQSKEETSLDFAEEGADFPEAAFDYASLRGGDYRDLTHEEAMRMRDAYQQKLLLDRRVRWLKSRALPDPDRDAAAAIRAQEVQTEDALVKSLGLDDGVRAARRLVRMEADAERQELASRIRAKMREEKLANAKLMKAALPNVQGKLHFAATIVDPIKFHVARRTIRQARLLQSQLEEFLTWNSAEVLHGLLGGASVSIHHVEQQTTRSVCYVFFTVASGHDPTEVEERLNRAAPHLRMQMARRLELGFTPPFRFVYYNDQFALNKHRLFELSAEHPRRKESLGKQKQQIIATSWANAMK
ncbi:hypothetical protein Efla_004426 [Eimeria flavescens]